MSGDYSGLCLLDNDIEGGASMLQRRDLRLQSLIVEENSARSTSSAARTTRNHLIGSK